MKTTQNQLSKAVFWATMPTLFLALILSSLILSGCDLLNKPDTSSARAIYPMRESWKLYQPVSVPGAGDRLPVLPEESEIVRRFGIEMGN
jgi:hypothetical protein